MPRDRSYSRFSMSLPPAVLRAAGKWNVPLYRATKGRVGGRVGRAPVLLLTTVGRRSGQPRTAPVLYIEEDDGRLIVIGSNAGNERAPAWALNLIANPEADVEVQADKRHVRARVTEGEERTELWDRMNAQYGGFDDYRARTSRDIPVFVLEAR